MSVASPSPAPSVMSDNVTIAHPTPSTSVPTTPGLEASAPSSSTTNSTSTQAPQLQQEQLTRAVTPSRSSSLPMFEFDPRNVLNQFSPTQFQQLLATLASQNILDPSTTNPSSPSVSAPTANPHATNLNNTGSNLTPYHQQSFDFSQPTSNFGFPFIAPESLISFGPYDPSSSSSSTSTSTSNNGAGANGTTGEMNLTLLNSASSQEQPEHEERMTKQWENTEVMGDNVDGLQSRIHSLAQALGLDPVLLDNDLAGHAAGDDEHNDDMDELQMGLQGQLPTATNGIGATGLEALPSSSSTATATSGEASMVDFDFDSFFNTLASPSTGAGTDLDSGMTAFLDEVPTPASSSDQTASPVLSKQDVVPEGSGNGTFGAPASAAPAKGTRKRKSEVAMDLDTPSTPLTTAAKTTTSNKAKRRKDK